MALVCYHSLRRECATALLVTGMSFGLSPCVLAEESAVSEAPAAETQEDEESVDTRPLRTIAATSLGATGGLGGTYIAGFIACTAFGERDWSDCRDHPVVLAGAILGGIGGGYVGHENGPFSLVFGGLVSGGVMGAFAAEVSDLRLPFYLGTAAGGYLGYRLWRVRESDGERSALLPYRDRERTGVMLSGRF